MAQPRASFFAEIDRLLRPAREQPAELAPEILLSRLVVLALVLGATYGFFIGWFSVALHWGTGRPDGYLQLLVGNEPIIAPHSL